MLLLLVACDDPERDRCPSHSHVQLVQTDQPRFSVELAGGHTYVSLDGDWVGDLDHALYVGEACGADARLIDRGIHMTPVGLHPDDPDAEDPRLVCDHFDARFFRIDPGGERPPELLLPRFNCLSLFATPHGPVLGDRTGRALWYLPAFPSDARAVELSDQAIPHSTAWLGERLYYGTVDGIRRRDLATGEDELLVPGAAEFVHTDTHLLWRGRSTGDSAPMKIRDLATGEDHPVGLYIAVEDQHDWDDPGPGWRFDADGAHILHLPNVPDSEMSAHDLTGAPVPFAGAGVRIAYPPVGGVVVQDGPTFRHAVAGSEVGVVLDVPEGAILDDIQAFDHHLEVRVGNELHAVPLDGGASSQLLRGVGAARTRIDEHLLLSLRGHDLTLFHQRSGGHWLLADQVEHFVYHPGHGVYYSRLSTPGLTSNGVWMISDGFLRSVFPE